MYPIKQSTAITVPFFVHDSSGDAVTGLTDGSFTKRISKNGAAFGAMTVTITELENGWYSIPLSTTHSDTLGLVSITFTNAGAKQINLQYRIHVRIPDDMSFPNITGRGVDVDATGGVEITVNQDVNVAQWDGAAVATPTIAGVPEVDVTHFVGTLAPTPAATGVPDVNAILILDVAPTLTNNDLDVNIAQIIGTAPSLTTGDLDVNVVTMATGSIASGTIAAAELTNIEDEIWDALKSAHTTPNSFGDFLDTEVSGVSGAGALVSSTTTSSGSTTTLIDTARTEIDDTWIGALVVFTSGTENNRCRLITEFDAGSDTITFAPAVSAAVGSSITYEIHRHAGVDVQSWLGVEGGLNLVATPTVAGVPEVDVTHFVGELAPPPATTGIPDVNVVEFLDTAVVLSNGLPDINVENWLGTIVTAATAGRPDVNTQVWNNEAIPATSVTGVPEVDVTHFVGTLAPTPATTGIPDVNTVEFADTSVVLSNGLPDINVENWLGTIVTAATAGTPDVNTLAINNDTNAAAVLAAWMSDGVIGTADTGTTTTIIDSARTEADDRWNGSMVVITSGVSAGQARLIIDFANTGGIITFAPAVTADLDTETYVIIPQAGVDIQSWLGTESAMIAPNALTSGDLDVNVTQIIGTAPTLTSDNLDVNVTTMTAGSIAAGTIASGELTNIEDEIWDALKSVHTTANTFGDFLDIEVSSRSSHSAANVWTVGTRDLTALGFTLANADASWVDSNDRVDVGQWLGGTIPTQTIAGVPEVDVTHFVGTLAPTPATTGVPDVNTVEFADTSVVLSDGLPDVNVEDWLGTIVTAATAGRPDVNTAAIDDNTTAASALSDTLQDAIIGTATSGSTTTLVDTVNLTQADDRWNGATIIITSGTSAGQARLITDFDAASDTITFAPAVSTTITTQTYVIVPKAGIDIQSWLGTESGMVAPNALTGGDLDVNVVQYGGGAVPAPSTTGVPHVNVENWLGAIVTAATAGRPDVNTQTWNNEAIPATSVTGVPEVDVTHFVGELAPPPAATGVPDVNTILILDTAPSLTGGDLDVNVAAMAANTITASAYATDAIATDALAASAIDKFWDEAMTETTGAPAITGSFRDAFKWMFALSRNKILQTSTLTTLRNDLDDGDLATSAVSDSAGTYTRNEWST